jgi:hypothetical protein
MTPEERCQEKLHKKQLHEKYIQKQMEVIFMSLKVKYKI